MSNQVETVHYLRAGSNGHILELNRCFARTLKIEADTIRGFSAWDFLVERDARTVQEFLQNHEAPSAELQLNFCDSLQHPITIRCWIEKLPDGFTLIGEIPADREQALNHELMSINNQLTATPVVRRLIAAIRSADLPAQPRIALGGAAFKSTPGVYLELGADAQAGCLEELSAVFGETS